MKKLPLILLLVTVVSPAGCWFTRLEGVRARYEAECVAGPAEPQQSPNTSAGISSMKEQSALLLNWALVALGAAIALITTSGTHRFVGIHWLFLLLAPALSFLAGSLWAGLLFQRRVTFLELNGCPATGTLIDLLLWQSALLQYAVWVMALFALVCLGQIVVGVVDPRKTTE